MDENEVYDKFFTEEEYNLEEAKPELYSYRHGWNDALKRASRVIRNDIVPEGEVLEGLKCSHCGKEFKVFSYGFCYCYHCGAKLIWRGNV